MQKAAPLTAFATALAAFAGWHFGAPEHDVPAVAPVPTATIPASAQPTASLAATPGERASALVEKFVRVMAEVQPYPGYPEHDDAWAIRFYALVRDFGVADFKPAIAALLASDASWRNSSAAELLAGLWAERDLPAAREWALGLKKPHDRLLQTVFDTWARRDLREACAWLQAHASELGGAGRYAKLALAKVAAETDPEIGLRTFAAVEPDGHDWGVLYQWAAIDPVAAAARAQAESDETKRTDLLRMVAVEWGRVDPVAARAWAEKLPGPLVADKTLLAVASGMWERVEPRSTADFLATLPQTNETLDFLGNVVSQWGQADLPAVLRWTTEQPDEALGRWSVAAKQLVPKEAAKQIDDAIDALPALLRARAAKFWQSTREEASKK